MRKFTMLLMLATSAIPAMASAQDEGERRGRQQRSERAEDRPVREQRADRPERAQQNEQRQQVQAERQAQREQMQTQRQAQVQQMQADRQSQMQQMQVDRQAQYQQVQSSRQAQIDQLQQQRNAREQARAARQGEQRNGAFGGRDRRGDDGQSREELMQQYRAQAEARRAQRTGGQVAPVGGLVERDGRYRSVPNINPNTAGRPAPENRDARLAHRDRRDGNLWSSSNWRNDRRYDWRHYRDQHRSTFRIGLYFDPFGYSYNRFGIGSYMYPGYYQSNYWINDPWQYRLPQAYGPYRWVRYHNDALMIDTWTGEVVDVIYGFFW